MTTPSIARRRLILAAGASLGLAPWVHVSAQPAPAWAGRDPFSLGVAAGDPRADGFVLWTRLAPEPLSDDARRPGGMTGPSFEIDFEIATDASMRRIVRGGRALAEAQHGYSVHLEVKDLAPQQHYWYRFTSGDAVSRIGHAQTTARVSDTPQSLRIAAVSCANYEHGYFAAYRHLIEDHPDFVLFLGDYLYEYLDKRGTNVRTHSGSGEPRTLPAYRNRYAQYRQDPDLQALHANVTCLITWDDHEVQNNYANLWNQYFVEPQAFLKRRAAAYQAFYEHMPLRPSRSLPKDGALRVHDIYRFGDLAEISMLDGRQYRSAPACQSAEMGRRFQRESDQSCPERLQSDRTMFGSAQEAWLFDNLAASKARWNILAQGVQMSQSRAVGRQGESRYGNDNWDGYPIARARLLRFLQERNIANPMVFSGDIHAHCAAALRPDFNKPDSPAIASEFVTTSISARGPTSAASKTFLGNNPHIQYFEGRQRGYVLADIEARKIVTRLRVIDDATTQQARVSTLKTLVVEAGQPGVMHPG